MLNRSCTKDSILNDSGKISVREVKKKTKKKTGRKVECENEETYVLMYVYVCTRARKKEIEIRRRQWSFTLEGASLSVSSSRPKAGHAGMRSLIVNHC